MSKAELENALRNEILEVCRKALSEYFDLDPVTQIRNVGAGEITLPLVDAEGNDKWPVLKVSTPRGKRNGEGGYIPYDGNKAADDYKDDCEIAAAKKAASAAKKEAEAKARAAKKEAKKIVKELNEKGLKGMIESAE
jgi:hypothetical protein